MASLGNEYKLLPSETIHQSVLYCDIDITNHRTAK